MDSGGRRPEPCATGSTALAVPAVDGEAVAERHPPITAEVRLELKGRRLVETTASLGRHRLERRVWVDSAHKQRFALVDVADARSEPLIEQHVADLRTWIGPVLDPTKNLIDIDGVNAEIGSEVIELTVASSADGDHRRSEAHRHRLSGLEHRAGEVTRLSPASTTGVEVPAPGHPEM